MVDDSNSAQHGPAGVQDGQFSPGLPHDSEGQEAKVALGIAAHPDDLDFSAGGTMALLASAGVSVYYLILTDGGKGSPDPGMPTKELVATRQAEQRAAAQALGVKDVFFLAYEDGLLEVTPHLKRDIVRHIRKLKPEVVLAFDPTMLYDAKRGFINHTDHRACGQAVLDAVYPLARDYLSFPELRAQGLQPHKVATVLLSNFEKHNYAVDISSTIEQKMQSIAAHTSQLANPQASLDEQRQQAAADGKMYSYGYAELFVRIDIPA